MLTHSLFLIHQHSWKIRYFSMAPQWRSTRFLLFIWLYFTPLMKLLYTSSKLFVNPVSVYVLLLLYFIKNCDVITENINNMFMLNDLLVLERLLKYELIWCIHSESMKFKKMYILLWEMKHNKKTLSQISIRGFTINNKLHWFHVALRIKVFLYHIFVLPLHNGLD